MKRDKLSARIERAIIQAGNRMADLPAEGTEQPLDRNSRLLAWILLLLFCLMVLSSLVVLLLEWDNPQLLLHLGVTMTYAALLMFCFLLNRWRYTRLAARGAVLIGVAAVWVVLLFDQQIKTDMANVPLYLVSLAIMLAAFLLSSWETGLIAVAQLLGLVWLLEAQEAWSRANWRFLFVYIVFISLLAIATSHIQQTNLQLIERQNQRLLENEAKLKDMTTRDSLTGLYNRHYLLETLPREISRVTRRNSNLGLIMIDLDQFNDINSQYGHTVADDLLRLVGQVLAGKIRASDIACRYAGDAFILMMPDATGQATFDRADSIRTEALSWTFDVDTLSLKNLTLTCGVASYPKHGTNGTALLEAAAAALRQARQAGGNRTGVAQ